MKVKKMRTLETRSMNTFSNRMTMFRGVRAPSLSLLLKESVNLHSYKLMNLLNLILMIEKVMVMKERIIESDLRVTSSPMRSMSVKKSGRL